MLVISNMTINMLRCMFTKNVGKFIFLCDNLCIIDFSIFVGKAYELSISFYSLKVFFANSTIFTQNFISNIDSYKVRLLTENGILKSFHGNLYVMISKSKCKLSLYSK